MRRRSLLGLAASAALGSTIGLTGRTRSARAFGQVPSDSGFLDPSRQVHSVLEIFLLGGVSPYESFYAVEEYGTGSTPMQWNAFARQDVQTALDACAIGSDPLLTPFGEDADGATVHLGPFVQPLRERSDLLDRMRMVVTQHDALPHEVAIPLALSGRIPGDPNGSGLGAHVQRYALEQGEGGTPSSYVLLPPSAIQNELARAALATGRHPGAVRPFDLKMDATASLPDLLRRETVGDARGGFDRLVGARVAAYRRGLGGAEDPRRAPAFDAMAASFEAAEDVDALAAGLPEHLFDAIRREQCGATGLDSTAMGLRMAAHLLTRAEGPTKRYVCVVDGGFGQQSEAGGYDTHRGTLPTTARNLTSTLRALTSIINAPGEGDPAKLDLDKTLVVLNTEFGRSPEVQGDGGRGHWPYAYPVVFLGGPIRKDNAGVRGALGADARATSASRPVAHRLATLTALGIWPFESESFNVSDVADAPSEKDAIEWITREYLGVS